MNYFVIYFSKGKAIYLRKGYVIPIRIT